MPTQLAYGLYIRRLFRIGKQCEIVRDLPQEDLPIIRRRCNDIVVERIPICVQHSGSVPTEQRYLVRELALLLQRYYRECASAAGLPIDGDILRVGLDNVRVPGVLADPEVIVALFAPSRATEYVSYASSSAHGSWHEDSKAERLTVFRRSHESTRH